MHERKTENNETDSAQGAIIGLDLGTTTGWSLVRDGVPKQFGHWTWKKKRGQSPGVRWLEFLPWLNEIIDTLMMDSPIIAVAYEQPFFRGGYATEVLQGYVTQTQSVCSKLNLQFIPVNVSSLKKYATGKGNADKNMMRAALNGVFDKNKLTATHLLNEHEIDAIWVGLYQWEMLHRKSIVRRCFL